MIDADVLLEHIVDVPTWTQMGNGEWRSKKYPAGMYDPEDVTSSIESAPTIDAEPVRHGRWEEYPNSAYRRCTNCKKEFEKAKFSIMAIRCPICGAQMRTTDERE